MTNRRGKLTGLPSNGDGASEAILQRIARTLDDHGVPKTNHPLYDAVNSGAVGTF